MANLEPLGFIPEQVEDLGDGLRSSLPGLQCRHRRVGRATDQIRRQNAGAQIPGRGRPEHRRLSSPTA